MRNLIRIDDELFDLSRVVYAHFDFDYDGGVALEFNTVQVNSVSYIPLGKLECVDRNRLRRFRFFGGKTASLVAEAISKYVAGKDEQIQPKLETAR